MQEDNLEPKPAENHQESSDSEARKPYVKPVLKNHGNLRLISQMS